MSLFFMLWVYLRGISNNSPYKSDGRVWAFRNALRSALHIYNDLQTRFTSKTLQYFRTQAAEAAVWGEMRHNTNSGCGSCGPIPSAMLSSYSLRT
jgi:hypothetical protein